jgi:hypothetical protein
MRPKLIISDESQETVNLLQEGLAGCEEVTVLKLSPDQLLAVEGLDAFYLSVMGAERWGARPIPRKAQVLRTTPDDAEKGYPPYVIAGGLFNMEDPRDPHFQLRTIMSAVLTAVESFNAENNRVIRKIGFWARDLCFAPMSPGEAGEIIKSVYQGRYSIPAL